MTLPGDCKWLFNYVKTEAIFTWCSTCPVTRVLSEEEGEEEEEETEDGEGLGEVHTESSGEEEEEEEVEEEGGKGERSSLSEEEGAEMSNGLTIALFPVPLHCWAGGNTENQEVEPKKKGRDWGKVL